jgi:hypothetical protein
LSAVTVRPKAVLARSATSAAVRMPSIASSTRNSSRAPGDQAAQHGADPPEQVGHADQVGQDEVPVEPQRWQQLLHHLYVDQEHGGEQRPVPRRQVDRREPGREDRVEVDAAEVGADAAGPAQPVGVGNVGEEGGPHHVDAHADDPGLGSSVAAGGGMAALVEQR